MGLVSVQKRPAELFVLPPRDGAVRRQPPVDLDRAFTGAESAGALTLDFPAYGTVRSRLLRPSPVSPVPFDPKCAPCLAGHGGDGGVSQAPRVPP